MNEYFIDTNIFMYAAGKPHEFKEPCVDILSRVQSGELKAAIYRSLPGNFIQIPPHQSSRQGSRPGMEHDGPGT